MKSLIIPLRRFSSVKLFFLFFTLAIFTSCQKNIDTPKMNEDIVFPTSDKDIARVALFKEVSDILFEVYQNPKAYYEVNAAILSEYYADERVLLKDLLVPEYSKLYQSEKFKYFKAFTGEFKKEFYSVLSDKESPMLRQALNLPSLQESLNSRFSAVAPTDTAMEIFSNSNGVSIYFPYSENFGSNFTPSYFDNINDSPYGDFATIVVADREADSGPGREPYRCGTRDNQSVCFRAKTVNDDYAEIHETHIVGSGATIQDDPPGPPPPIVSLIYIGEVRCTKQFDRFISFTGNGGGSELRFGRGDAYLVQNTSQQITNFQNVVSVNLKRKKIRKENWVRCYSIWDSNWEVDNKEQVFSIWEDDNEGSSTINLGIKTTVKLSDTVTGEGNVGFSIVVKTKDDIIRQLGWNRQSFFAYNHGNLNNGCGARNTWTVYDCNSNVSYTMPQQ